MRPAMTRYNTPLQQLLLLEERVRRAGVTLPEDADQPARFHGIKCLIDGVQCLLDIRDVAEVIEQRHVTPIPGSLSWIEGIMNYRGLLVPVYNLRSCFDPDARPAVGDARQQGALVVCHHGQEKLAVRVDRVAGMQKYLLDDFTTGTTGPDGARGMEHYIDAGIGSGENRWWRFGMKALLDDLAALDPMQRQAEAV